MVDLPDDEYEERVERARLARKEARETIDEQTATLSDIDEKAIQIFRINLVVASILAAGFSIAVSSNQVTHRALISWYTLVGIAFLFISIILAAITYTSTSERIGIDSETIRAEILNQDYDYDLVEEEIALEYGKMIRYNYRKNASNALLFTFTLLAAVTSISYLGLGLLDLYLESGVPDYATIVFAVFLLILGKLSGLYGTLIRWNRATDPYKRFKDWLFSWVNRIFNPWQ